MRALRVWLAGSLSVAALGCGQRNLTPLVSADAGADADAIVMASGGSPTLADGRCVVGAFAHGDAGCMCEDGLPTVCAAGCTDVTSDDDNCGACGHPCTGTSVCNAGTCGPQPTTVVPAAPGCAVINLAVAGGTLFWTDQGHGKVESMPVAGGPVTTLASREPLPGLIAVSGSTVLWVDTVSAMKTTADAGYPITITVAVVREVVLPKGAPTVLVTETNTNGGINGLAVSADGKTLFESADTKVRAVPLAGGPAVDVALEATLGVPGALAVDGDTIAYPTGFNGDVDVVTIGTGTIASCGPYDATTQQLLLVDCVRVSRGQGELLLAGIAIHGGDVYWSNDGSIRQSPVTTGADNEQVAVAVAGGQITTLVGGPSALYFGEDGLVERTPYASGATAIALVRGQTAPMSLAVDATRVYWSTGDCAINATGL